MKVSKDVAKGTDKRLLEREHNQGRAGEEEVQRVLSELPDLAERVASAPDSGDLGDELAREKGLRDERIARLIERAAAPKPLPAPPPEPFDE
jgi:hypothetical protein